METVEEITPDQMPDGAEHLTTALLSSNEGFGALFTYYSAILEAEKPASQSDFDLEESAERRDQIIEIMNDLAAQQAAAETTGHAIGVTVAEVVRETLRNRPQEDKNAELGETK